MATTTKDRTTSADLAARLREQSERYSVAVKAEIRARSDYRAALKELDRSEYALDRARAEWDARVPTNLDAWRDDSGVTHAGLYDANGNPTSLACSESLTGFGVLKWVGGSSLTDCPACLAALDEVQA
jgi:hypothetical protein